MNKVYLDNAATTPIDLEVIKTMQESMQEHLAIHLRLINSAGRQRPL